MELDLQSLFGLQCTAVLICWDPASPPPLPPPHLGSFTRALNYKKRKKVLVFPVPSWDVTNKTPPGRELLNYTQPLVGDILASDGKALVSQGRRHIFVTPYTLTERLRTSRRLPGAEAAPLPLLPFTMFCRPEGMGRSARLVMADSSSGLLASTRARLAASTASSSSTWRKLPIGRVYGHRR